MKEATPPHQLRLIFDEKNGRRMATAGQDSVGMLRPNEVTLLMDRLWLGWK